MKGFLEAVVIFVWSTPFLVLLLAGWGLIKGRRFPRLSGKNLPERLIIQITTVGKEWELVESNIALINNYALSIPCEIWVISEPGFHDEYRGATRTIEVPADFTCDATHKARAMEYARQLRAAEGLDGGEVKLLFVDDDSLPTKGYVEAAYYADYDICEGFVSPCLGFRRGLGIRNLGLQLIAQVDNMRTLGCLSVCSVFQGCGHPIHVHGEGLSMRSSTEQAVTWNHKIFASEDLVVGQLSVHDHFRFGFFYEAIQITSPWSWKALLIQRRRWLWGNIHAIKTVLPKPIAVILSLKYMWGSLIFVGSSAASIVDLARLIGGFGPGLPLSTTVRVCFLASIVAWLMLYGIVGWINSQKSIVYTIFSMFPGAWVTSIGSVLVLWVALFMGNPRRFQVIEKTRKTHDATDRTVVGESLPAITH